MDHDSDCMSPLDSFVSSKGPICYGILKPGHHFPDGIPVIKVKNIKNGVVIENDLLFTSPKIHRQYKRSELKAGDLLLTIRGTTGRVAIVPSTLQGANITQDTARIRVSTDDSPIYLYYALQSSSLQKQVKLNTVGQAVKGINIAEVRKLKVFHPSKNKQTKIAQILTTWDKAIETTEKLIENSKAQKNALMQQLLTGKKRFSGFKGKWQEVRINQMGKVISGGTPDTKNSGYWGGDVLWATPTDITSLKTRHIKDTKRKITKTGVKESSATLLPPGALLICTRATIGELAITEKEITTNQGFKSLVLNKLYDSDFVYYMFQYFKHEFVRYACGSTFLEISKKDFEKRTFLVPEKNEQAEISKVLNNCAEQISELCVFREYLRTEKKALMQQLLTGKRRVKVVPDYHADDVSKIVG